MATRFTVLVTGVGALIGQGIIAGLRADGRARVIGLDRNPSALADHLCDVFVPKPAVDEGDPDYQAFWADLLERHQVDLVLPGISIDMFFLDARRAALGRLAALALNTSEMIALTRDKLDFHAACAPLRDLRIATERPATWAEAVETLGPPPLLLKPRRGEGSAGLVRLHDAADFDYWRVKSGDNWLVQPVVGRDDAEFTIGTFGFGDGTALEPAITFRRRLSRAGNTGEAEVARIPALNEATARLVRRFRPRGPTNLQFRLDDGIARLLEINPRFSSSCSLRLAFGYNEAAMCIDHYLLDRRPAEPVIRSGRALRYNADFVTYADDHI